MEKIFNASQSTGKALGKMLGYTALLALVFQFFVPGFLGPSSVSAQTATTTSLTVTKVVVGGDLVAGDVELFVNGTPVTSGVPLEFASTSIPSAPVVVSETAVAGYTATFTGDCAADGTVTIVEGEQLECTITNTLDVPATATTSLTVTKIVEGGDMEASEFELFINATPVTSGVPLVFASTSIPTAPLTVSETPVAGYTATFGGDCAVDGTVTITLGEELECTITNTFATTSATTTSLTVTKVVEGGALDVEDFPLFVNGIPVLSGVATTTLPAGVYAITETSVPGYTATFSGDCAADGSITLALGDDLECTITNTFGDISATSTSLTVTKVVEGGGDLDAGDFPLFVNGMSITSGVATTTLAAGTYFISEISNSDYDATFSGDCAANGSITITLGVAANCVITNTFDPDDVSRTPSQFNPNVNVNVETGEVTVNEGDTEIVLGSSTFPFTFPGQVLGAGSVVPVYYQNQLPGQVLGAQSYVPGLPTTGAEPLSEKLPNIGLIALAGLLGMVGAGLIVAPSSKVSSSTTGDMR